MKRWEESMSISATPEAIFAYVSDFTRHGEWGGHGLTVSKLGDGPVAVGSKYATTAKQFGTQREESTITDLNPPGTFAWDSVGALGRIHHWFTLRAEGGVTTVSKGAAFVDAKFLAKMTMFKISKDLPKGLRNDLANIKAKMENRA